MKNILMYLIVLAVVIAGIWLFARKSNNDVSLYDASPSVSGTSTETVSGSPQITPTPRPSTNMITTASGLRYQDITIGKGTTAKAGDNISVHYIGTLANGKKFDSSYDRGQPFQFRLGVGQVIPGWDEGVAGMKVGGKRRLVIPPNLGYGNQDVGEGLIPPNSTLIFDVELVGIP